MQYKEDNKKNDLKILVVDDRHENIIAMQEILKSLNAEIFTATSGKKAVSLVLRHDFAVVLLDVQMPGLNGFETANLIRNNEGTRNLPIIFITAFDGEKKYEGTGYQTGGIDYLFKPIDEDILLAKVNILLALKHQEQSLKKVIAENEALLLKQNQLHSEKNLILNTAGEGIIGTDYTGKIVFANNSAERLLGLRSSEILKKSITDFIVNPSRKKSENKRSENDSQIESIFDTPKEHYFSFIREDGSLLPVEYTATLSHSQIGGNLGAVIIFQDISAKVEAEKRILKTEECYKLVLGTVSDGWWEANLLTGKNYFNTKLKMMLGYNIDDETDLTHEKLIHPDDYKLWHNAYKQHIENETPFKPIVRYLHTSGKYIWTMGRGIALKNTDNQYYRMIGIVTVITDIKRIEEALLKRE